MNIENMIKREAVKLRASQRNVDIAPDLDSRALSKYSEFRSIEDYILVMSCTRTGSFALTGNALYYDNFWQGGVKCIEYKDIQEVRSQSGGMFSTDKIFIKLHGNLEIQLDGCVDGINIELFARMLSFFAEKAKKESEDFQISRQGVLTSDLPEEVKLLYLEILCNYAYLNDRIINAEEYNAITKFSIRMEIDRETRKKLRNYMLDYEHRVKTGRLLSEIKQEIRNETGYQDAVRYCLMQDVLYIHEIQSPGKPWQEDGFIGSLMELCLLNPRQIQTMQTAVGLNRNMQKRADLEQMNDMKKRWSEFVKSIRYTQGYVPASYLFCSGSVYSLQSYNCFFRSNGEDQAALSKQREIILQEIIINQQKIVSAIIDDMNFLAEKLEKAIAEGKKVAEDYAAVKRMLMQLRKQIEIELNKK